MHTGRNFRRKGNRIHRASPAKSGIEALSKAVLDDPSFFVRHEAAVALGVIGSEETRKTLEQALKDESEEVKESAMIALANLDYISHVKRTNKFTSLTGG